MTPSERPARPHFENPGLIPSGLVTQRQLLDLGLESLRSAVATVTLDGRRELLYDLTTAEPRIAPVSLPKTSRQSAHREDELVRPTERVSFTAARDRVRDLLDREDVLVLDTETTGGGPRSEIIEVALMDTTGAVKFNSLVRPSSRIQPGAQRVHGLTQRSLEGAPMWSELDEAFREAVTGRTVLAYNVAFDRGMVRQTRERYALKAPLLITEWGCAMRLYAATIGRRQIGLERAAKLEGVLTAAQSHRALGDVQLTLALLRASSVKPV